MPSKNYKIEDLIFQALENLLCRAYIGSESCEFNFDSAFLNAAVFLEPDKYAFLVKNNELPIFIKVDCADYSALIECIEDFICIDLNSMDKSTYPKVARDVKLLYKRAGF